MFTNQPYSCEYAKSGRARCKKCSNSIAVNSLRLSVLVQSYFSDDRIADKFHYHCFFSRAQPLGPEEIDGFEYLRYEDQRQILDSIRKKSKIPGTNKRKLDEIEEEEEEDEKLSEELKEQSNLLFENLESFTKLPRKHFAELLVLNKLKTNDSRNDSYNLADAFTFGLPDPCPKCSNILLYKVGRYVCQGFFCSYSTKDPKRQPFNISEELYEFLDNYQFDPKFKRISDPTLEKCFQIRSNQVLDSISKNLESTPSDPTTNLPVDFKVEPDPSCELRNVHILKDGETFYNAELTKVNILENKNSFYKIQILEENSKRTGKYYLFKVYGRIGTTIKGRRVEEYSNKEDAISAFEASFHRQTGWNWVDRKAFSVPKGNSTYSYMDLVVEDGKVDGKLSKEQLEKAYFTLKRISQFGIVDLENVKEFVNLWNKFYTLFPETFGTERPALWAPDSEMLEQMMEMIDCLINYGM